MFLLFAFFIFVTLSQAVFLLLAKNSVSKSFKKKLWNIHYSFNGLLWIILTFWIIFIQTGLKDIEFSIPVKITGAILVLLGCFLSINNTKKLSLRQAMGYRFFTDEKITWISSGTYSFLKNPIYDGFILVFLGLGFLVGIVANFYLALLSFILLNVILASIEKEKTGLDLKQLF